MSEAAAAHWDGRYRTVGAESVSWYESTPTTSLALLSELGVGPQHSVIDVGGGASTLVDHLLEDGHTDVAVLDVSSVALDVARSRVGAAAPVTWLTEDVLRWKPNRQWDVWHDRAVLHFLLDDDDRRRYVGTLREAVGIGGAVIIGVFAEDGPTECSALPVKRQSARELRELLAPIDVVEQRRVLHRTPSGTTQAFNWLAARLT